MVYFLRLQTGAIKIGSTGNVDNRVKYLDRTYVGSVTLLAVKEGDRTTEFQIHRQFAHLRLSNSEQFQPGPDLMTFIGKPIVPNHEVIPKTPPRYRRLLVSATKSMTTSFRVLALNNEKGGDGAASLSDALARYAEHISKASQLLDRVLARSEWNVLANVLQSCDDIWDRPSQPMSNLRLICARIEAGHRLDGLGYKWFGDGEAGDKGIKTLLIKLGKLTEIEGDAITASVRYFWADALGDRAIDRMADEWWTLAYRTRPKSATPT